MKHACVEDTGSRNETVAVLWFPGSTHRCLCGQILWLYLEAGHYHFPLNPFWFIIHVHFFYFALWCIQWRLSREMNQVTNFVHIINIITVHFYGPVNDSSRIFSVVTTFFSLFFWQHFCMFHIPLLRIFLSAVRICLSSYLTAKLPNKLSNQITTYL
jgi:hypothetical protein